MEEAVLTAIRLHPIKALDAVSVSSAAILPGGGLVGDRRWALFDDAGQFVNGKRCPALLRVRAHFSEDGRHAVLSVNDHPQTQEASFALEDENGALERWLSAYLGQAVHLRRDDELGFPDDRKAAGPTVVSTASLDEVASWFPGLSQENVRRRFRANLEIAAPAPFWEDRLFGDPGAVVHFRVGDVEMIGTNPCQRCSVPSRDPDSAAVWPGFQKRFGERRANTLPAWTTAGRFDHFYRFAVNTRVAASEIGKVLRTGDFIRVMGTAPG